MSQIIDELINESTDCLVKTDDVKDRGQIQIINKKVCRR